MACINMEAIIRYRAVDAYNGRNADEVISRPNKRAPTAVVCAGRRPARRCQGRPDPNRSGRVRRPPYR
jgi:hypothetical protein